MIGYSSYFPIVFAITSISIAATDGIKAAIMYNSGAMIEGSGYVEGPVTAGSEAVVHWALSKRTECAGVSSRLWQGVGGFYLKEALGATTLPIGENQTYNIKTKIPEQAPVGPLSLSIEGEYKCPTVSAIEFELGPVLMIVEE